MRFIVDQQVEDIEMPENLKLNTFLQEFHSDCPHPECDFGFYGFAFGQSPFPVPNLIQDALIKNVNQGAYAPVPGIPELRSAISRYNKHYFGIDIDPKRIYVGPGTKELIFNLLEILHGTVILPTPAWLGYLPQIRFLKKNYHMLPTRANKKISPNDLRKLALRLQHALTAIEGIKATKPESTFYLLADFNSFATDLQKVKIDTSQRLSEALIVHPYHTAIVGGDSLVLERTDFSARIAYVDYDGAKTFQNYVENKPKTSSERLEFVKENAPKIVAGISMIERFFENVKDDLASGVQKQTLITSN